jgi:NAD(P)-dependent dehydrogenase (short-subunit alcohol dehydrogenase family)
MNKTIVITGASSGIGANAAGRLAAAGWQVAVVGRDPARTAAVAEAAGAQPFLADFDRLDDVRALAAALSDRYVHIDVLANNAGGMLHKRGLSVDGYERTLQLNHLAPFLLTALLMPRLQGGRIIGTASVANRFGSLRLDDLQWARRSWGGGWRAYGTSKIATIVFVRALAQRGFDAYSFHPGYVATSFGAESPLVKVGNALSGGRLAISPEQGATPLVELASAATVDAPSGTYFDGLKPNGRVSTSANAPGIEQRLWDASAALVGLES